MKVIIDIVSFVYGVMLFGGLIMLAIAYLCLSRDRWIKRCEELEKELEQLKKDIEEMWTNP